MTFRLPALFFMCGAVSSFGLFPCSAAPSLPAVLEFTWPSLVGLGVHYVKLIVSSVDVITVVFSFRVEFGCCTVGF